MADQSMYVYVSNAKSNEILVLRLNPENGDLELVQRAGVSGKVMPMAVSPDRRFLYAGVRSTPHSIASFAIDAISGELTHLADAPLPDSTPYINTDRTGRFLLAALNPEGDPASPSKGGGISVSAISPHGFVLPAHQMVRTEPQIHAIVADPANRYVIASSCAGGVVLRFAFDTTTGLLSSDPLPPVRLRPNNTPRHFVFHPNNRFLYMLSEADASIYTFGYDANAGALREIQIVSALPADFSSDEHVHAADIHLTPDGRHLYASERASNTLAAFKVDLVSGMLAPAGHFQTEKSPRGFNIDPFGRFVLVAGRSSNNMGCYSINRDTGSLTRLKVHPMGKEPNWVEIVRLP